MPSVAIPADVEAPNSHDLIVNKRELARQILKCSLPTLNDLIERYPDFPVELRGSNGVEWQFDAARVTKFLEDQREAEQRDSVARSELFKQFSLPIDEIAGDEAAGMSPTQRAALARARMAERKLALESGFLLQAAETRQALQTTLARFGKFLDGLPAELGRQFGLPDDVTVAMRSRIDEQRRQIVRELQAFLTQDRAA